MLYPIELLAHAFIVAFESAIEKALFHGVCLGDGDFRDDLDQIKPSSLHVSRSIQNVPICPDMPFALFGGAIHT